MKKLKTSILYSITLLTACTSMKKPPELMVEPRVTKMHVEKSTQVQPLEEPSRKVVSSKEPTNIQEEKVGHTTVESSDVKQKTNSKIKSSSSAQQSVTSWQLSGAIAAKNQRKSWTASVNWVQRGASSYQIRLYGPLGGGTVIVEKRGGVISFTDGAKKVTSSSADQLLLKQTGVRLPVSSLYYWVRGIPAPGGVSGAQYLEGNRLARFQQNGFTVTYLQYTSVNGVNLPTRIQLQGPGVWMKLVIKNWNI